jgi:3-oxoacyl-[acyl-carrier protein] reductase
MNKKVALITGGTRGIGSAIADIFEENNYFLYLTGTKNDEIERLNATGNTNRHYLCVDFSNSLSVIEFFESIKKINEIDVLVNNAGINIIKNVDNISEYDFDKIASINSKVPFMLSQKISKTMKVRKQGKIINIASIWSVVTKKGRSLYCTTKSGLAGMTRSFATDLAEYNVLVNSVSPGFTLTDLTKKSLSKEELTELEEMIPLQRLADPHEIARLVYFLGSSLNTYITGQNIIIDGGFSNV